MTGRNSILASYFYSRRSSLLVPAVLLACTGLCRQSAIVSRSLRAEYKQPAHGEAFAGSGRGHGFGTRKSSFGSIGQLAHLPTPEKAIEHSEGSGASVLAKQTNGENPSQKEKSYDEVAPVAVAELKNETLKSSMRDPTNKSDDADTRHEKPGSLRGRTTHTKAVEKTIATCEARRDPTWEWKKYSHQGETKASARLLIASYSSYGSYARLLELTAPINKAYAKRWNHDFVTLQGSALSLEEDGECEPPAQRAMYNKLDILQLALQKKDQFDHLLLLDADAMIYDLSYDISKLMDKDDMLAAHRVSQVDPEPRTWNINNGIVLWNLYHNETKEVADEWYASTNNAFVKAGAAHGDQHYLHDVLRRNYRHKLCKGLAQEFFYQKGTVVKHFIRTHATNEWNNTRIDAREEDIENTADAICLKFPKDCEQLEHSSYA
jgi:hypothetical protein